MEKNVIVKVAQFFPTLYICPCNVCEGFTVPSSPHARNFTHFTKLKRVLGLKGYWMKIYLGEDKVSKMNFREKLLLH